MPDKYRPANGTEGESFMAEWCEKCQMDQDPDNGCPIVAETFARAVNDPLYPREWTYDANGKPCCTAFVPEGDPPATPRCERTDDMFGGES